MTISSVFIDMDSMFNFGNGTSGIAISNWDEVLTELPYAWLRKAQIFFYVAFPIYGAATLACGVYQWEDKLLMGCGSLALLFPILIRYLPEVFKLVYTIWFDLSVLLILIGLALMQTHKGFSESFFIIGGIFLLLLVFSPCMGCNILATRRDAAPSLHGSVLTVAFQPVENDSVADVD